MFDILVACAHDTLEPLALCVANNLFALALKTLQRFLALAIHLSQQLRPRLQALRLFDLTLIDGGRHFVFQPIGLSAPLSPASQLIVCHFLQRFVGSHTRQPERRLYAHSLTQRDHFYFMLPFTDLVVGEVCCHIGQLLFVILRFRILIFHDRIGHVGNRFATIAPDRIERFQHFRSVSETKHVRCLFDAGFRQRFVIHA